MPNTDPELVHSWRLHYERIAPVLVGYLAAQGVARPADLVVGMLVDAARRLDGTQAGGRALRLWAMAVAHKTIVKARRRVDTDRIAQPMLLDRLTMHERDVLLLRLLGGLSVEQVAMIVRRRRRSVAMLERVALEVLREQVCGVRGTICDADAATLIAGDGFPADVSLAPLASSLEHLRTAFVRPAPIHIADQHLAEITDARTAVPAARI
jgi:RNA polymerase sigma-70 factor (ECF subfamily)